jgi:hypothetical protein
VIFASQVVEHVLTPVDFMRRARGLLEGDGILHLDVPNHAGLSAWARRVRPTDGEYGFLQPPHHQIAYTRATLERLVREAGFVPIEIKAVGNTDSTWGQLTVTKKPLNRLGMQVAGTIGLGSLLVALARQ